MTVPWIPVQSLGGDAYAAFRRRAIFDCCKWDPQVEDLATLAPFPLVIRPETWTELSSLAASLARETLSAEAELIERPALHGQLGLPARCRAELRRGEAPTPGVARLIRFDFHHTPEGWRISEANTDVPGGLNESSGVAELMAEHYPGLATAGDVAGAYARALTAASAGGPIALVHATAYTDDHQVMAYLARRVAALGSRTMMVSPAQMQWRGGRAELSNAEPRPAVVARFYPGEWLSDLPRRCEWMRFFRGGVTPLSNPATALLTQSKRVPLVWNQLRTPMPTWQSLLPETRSPRDVPRRERGDWVLKPALGRVGDSIGIEHITPSKELRRITRAATLFPKWWIAQRRFDATALETDSGPMYPCVGVYTIDDQVVGAYGRIASRPLIDWRARDVSVLVANKAEDLAMRRSA